MLNCSKIIYSFHKVIKILKSTKVCHIIVQFRFFTIYYYGIVYPIAVVETTYPNCDYKPKIVSIVKKFIKQC